jgi:hypothetical protein
MSDNHLKRLAAEFREVSKNGGCFKFPLMTMEQLGRFTLLLGDN